MTQRDLSRPIRLCVPAGEQHTLVVSMSLGALGLLAGLDVDLIGDLTTVSQECVDCLTHQKGAPAAIAVTACVCDAKLSICFEAQDRAFDGEADELALEITQSVLETLVPEVDIRSDEGGVHAIYCRIPV